MKYVMRMEWHNMSVKRHTHTRVRDTYAHMYTHAHRHTSRGLLFKHPTINTPLCSLPLLHYVTYSGLAVRAGMAKGRHTHMFV